MFYRPNDKVMNKLSCINRKNQNIKDRILYGPNGLSPIATGRPEPFLVFKKSKYVSNLKLII